MTSISIFDNIAQTKNGKQIPIDIFLEGIREGKWQDWVLPLRTLSGEALSRGKKHVPYVTLSGTFSERKDAAIINHSGFIGIDIDDVDPEDTKSIVCPDPYVYAAFTSVSGKGLCAIFKINKDKHREVFGGISEYLYEKYRIIVDPTSVNPSRARFVSFDPGVYVNHNAEKFTYVPKQNAPKKITEVLFVQNDFDTIVNEISARGIDITDGYATWLRIGFSIADKFGESGRHYFHAVSKNNTGYNPKLCDRQYTNCLRAQSGITISTFYFYAKKSGINIISEQTRLIAQAAHFAKKGRRTKESAIEFLQDAEGISPVVSTPIVDEVFDKNITVDTKDSPIDAIEGWLRQNYSLRRNTITRKIENHGREVESKELNSIFIAAKKIFEKEVSSELIEKIIYSDFTLDYNPFMEFFEKHQARKPKGVIRSLFDTLESDTGISGGEFFPDYKVHFGTKWFVGMVSAIHGNHCPLMIVLSGNVQGTGKTEWWRRLLPKELRKYYAESKLDAGKDDEILMTQKLVIMDDEMGGKSKAETKRLKELTSKQTFSLREPYGRANVDLERLCMLGATSNDNELLNDPTGNRRLIPINIISINHELYNKVDKVDVLMEAYWLYKEGAKWDLTREDIKILNDNTGYFEQASPEFELLNQYFKRPEKQDDTIGVVFKTATSIKSYLEIATRQNLNLNRIGMELKKLGWVKKEKRIGGLKQKGYYLIENASTVTGASTLNFETSGDAQHF
jgi:hypothetical protein